MRMIEREATKRAKDKFIRLLRESRLEHLVEVGLDAPPYAGCFVSSMVWEQVGVSSAGHTVSLAVLDMMESLVAIAIALIVATEPLDMPAYVRVLSIVSVVLGVLVLVYATWTLVTGLGAFCRARKLIRHMARRRRLHGSEVHGPTRYSWVPNQLREPMPTDVERGFAFYAQDPSTKMYMPVPSAQPTHAHQQHAFDLGLGLGTQHDAAEIQ
jgi:hypothetical protein